MLPVTLSRALGWVSERAAYCVPDPIKRVAESPIGRVGLGVVGNSLGMYLGEAHPILASTLAVSQHAGDTAIRAGLITFALGTALSYAAMGDSGLASACSFLLISAGTIAGGMVGTTMSGGEAPTPGMIFKERRTEVKKEHEQEIEPYKNEIVGITSRHREFGLVEEGLQEQLEKAKQELQDIAQTLPANANVKNLEQKVLPCNQKIEDITRKLEACKEEQDKLEQEMELVGEQVNRVDAKFLAKENQVSLVAAYRDSYLIRTAQYLVAKLALQKLPITLAVQVGIGYATAAGLISMEVKNSPLEVLACAAAIATLTGGYVASSIPLIAYYAADLPDWRQFAKEQRSSYLTHRVKPNSIGFADPGNAVQKLYGEFAREKNGQIEATFIGKLLPLFVGEKGLLRAVDNKIAMTALARSLNEYMQLTQSDEMQALTKDFTVKWNEATHEQNQLAGAINLIEKSLQGNRSSTKELLDPLNKRVAEIQQEKKVLQEGFRQNIYKQLKFGLGERFTTHLLSKATNSWKTSLYGTVDLWMSHIGEQEKEKTGLNLSDTEKNAAILKSHLVNYLKLAALQLQSSLKDSETKNLTDEEIVLFYRQLNQIFFSQYQSVKVIANIGGFIGDILPVLLREGRFLLAPFFEDKIEPVDFAPQVEEVVEEKPYTYEEPHVKIDLSPKVELTNFAAQKLRPLTTVAPRQEKETLVHCTPAHLFFVQILTQLENFFLEMGESIAALFKEEDPEDKSLREDLARMQESLNALHERIKMFNS